ncbi:hypothetical protein [Streptomyces sp. NPDC048386]|uniref:hypothetical protein n=1 Tax=Streptomyces sp. NPDC048386 TaxID=3365541 RepID=UPI0037238DFC
MSSCPPAHFCPAHPDAPGLLLLAAVAVLAILLIVTAAAALICTTAEAGRLITRRIARARHTKERHAMTTPTDPDELTGSFGTARRIPRDAYRGTSPAALDGWVITAPGWHPLWSQYHLGVVTLADVPGAPPANITRPGATHELNVVALNPDHGPHTPTTILANGLRYLTPVNIAEQFTTTDDQARQLAYLCARAVIHGVLNPESADAPERIRAAWHSTIHQTLQHDHAPHHGRPN